MKTLNKIKLVTLIGIFALILGACAPVYQQPQHGPVANLGFIQTPELRHSTTVIYKDGYDCRNSEDLGPIISKNYVIKIPANREVGFDIQWFGDHSKCNLLFSFHPEANKNYLLLFKVTNIGYNRLCNIAISETSQDKISPVKINPREENLFALTAKDAFCKPLKK